MRVKNGVTGKELDLPKSIIASCIAKGIPLRSLEGKDVQIPNVLAEGEDLRKKLNGMDRPTLDEAAKELEIDPTKFSTKEKLIEEIMSNSK